MKDKGNIRYYSEEILERGCGIDVFDEWSSGIVKAWKTSFYNIVLIKSGEFFIDINFERFKVASNTVMITRPGDVVSWDEERNVDFLELSFHESVIRKMFLDDAVFQSVSAIFDYSAPHVYVVDERQFFDLYHNIRCVDVVLGLDDFPLKRYALMARVVDVFCIMCDLHANINRSLTVAHEAKSVNSFRCLVDVHYSDWPKIASYAESMCMSESSLLKQVKKRYGKTPKQMIQERRILEAKQLLLYSNDDVESIAVKVGYNDSKSFIRAFGDYVGLSVFEFMGKNKK